MATTKTSFLSSEILDGFADELAEIGFFKSAMSDDAKKRLKTFARNTALIGAGTGVGYGGGMLAEKLIHKIERSPMPKTKKLRLIGAALGLAGGGAFVGKEWQAHARRGANK